MSEARKVAQRIVAASLQHAGDVLPDGYRVGGRMWQFELERQLIDRIATAVTATGHDAGAVLAERQRIRDALQTLRFDVRGADDGEIMDEWEDKHPEGQLLRVDDVMRVLFPLVAVPPLAPPHDPP